MANSVVWNEKYFNRLFNYALLNSEYDSWVIHVQIGNKIYTNEKDYLKDDELYINFLDKKLRRIFEKDLPRESLLHY